MLNKALIRVHSRRREPAALVGELWKQFQLLSGPPAGILLFRDTDYADLELAALLRATFACPIASCTTAGEISDEYALGGAVAVAFSACHFAFHQVELPNLSEFNFRLLPDLARSILEQPAFPGAARFGLLLVDGLSSLEESLVAQLHRAFQGLPLVGGSAGDGLQFDKARVFCAGRYQSNAASFTVVESHLPFDTLHLQHFEPSSQDLVITRSDPSRRIVYEIDGAPAAPQLARLLGMQIGELTPQIFSKHPMMLQIGDEWYVRSVQKVNDDDSLSFFCAIDDGLPLTIASGVGLVETLRAQVERLERDFKRVHLTIGFDCVLRRLEIAEKNLIDRIEPLLRRLHFCGFSGYGEQYRSLHVNQTLTGIVLGEK